MRILAFIAALLISCNAMAFTEITDKTFYKKVTNSKGYVLVDFYATWCGVCKFVHPMLENIAKKRTNVQFYQIDAEKNETSSYYFRVHYYPTILLFKDGGDPIEIYASREQSEMDKQIAEALKEKR